MKKSGIVIIVLSFMVVALLVLVLYAFVFQPMLTGYAVQKQTEGVQIAVNSILLQIQQQGYVQIPLNENQTLYLAPFDPNQAQAPQNASQ